MALSKSIAASTRSVRSRADPIWGYCIELKGADGKRILKCVYVKKLFKGGGINRVKHLTEIKRDAISCKKNVS